MFDLIGLISKLNLPPEVAEALRNARAADQRQAFTNVLLATVAHVNNKQDFNLELEINDLWTRLFSLKSIPNSQGHGFLSSLVDANVTSDIMKDLAKMVNSLSKVQIGIINSLR